MKKITVFEYDKLYINDKFTQNHHKAIFKYSSNNHNKYFTIVNKKKLYYNLLY